jgi:hypothetical protein
MAGRIAPLNRKPRRGASPLPGAGGYDYPRGPYGATGFPGSAPAAPPTHPQTPEGQRGARQTHGEQITHGVPQWSPTQNQAEWNRFLGPDGFPYNPAARNQPLATGYEKRTDPAINRRPPGDQKQRNTVYYGGAQAMPGTVRAYLSAPNPGKHGGRPARDQSAGYDNDAGAVVGGQPGTVMVPSRLVLPADSDGYAVQRPIPIRTHAFPAGYSGDRHLRGAVLSGERYFGPVRDQQEIGLNSDAYGISRRRGPRHRPVRFERPAPWSANYYDVPPEQGTQAPDMIHRSPGGRARKGRTAGGHSAAPVPRRGPGKGKRR